MLDEKQIELIDRKLSHVYKKHVGELLDITNRLVSQIEPNKNATIASSLEAIPQDTLVVLARYGDDITREVIGTVSGLNVDLEDKDKQTITATVEKYLEESFYEKRFQIFLESIHRQLGRYGMNVDLQQYRVDIQKSLYDVGTKNTIRSNIAKLHNELDTFILKKRSKTTNETEVQESKFEKANRAVKLEPNFFGIGLNVNYLLTKVFGKKK
jgi:bifunctional DNA-binding transcriptional regulator/antitoxin component of YhaV-PrlF toxin-antitoxin module